MQWTLQENRFLAIPYENASSKRARPNILLSLLQLQHKGDPWWATQARARALGQRSIWMGEQQLGRSRIYWPVAHRYISWQRSISMGRLQRHPTHTHTHPHSYAWVKVCESNQEWSLILREREKREKRERERLIVQLSNILFSRRQLMALSSSEAGACLILCMVKRPPRWGRNKAMWAW